MKWLTICQGGNVRSVSMAYVLKYGYGQDAIAVSDEKTGDEAFSLLSAWADLIIAMQPHFGARVPVMHRSKLRVVDVGDDRWGNPLANELVEYLSGVAREWQARGWQI